MFFVVCSSLSAGSQKTYNYNDKEYILVKYISQVANVSLPHDVTPVSGSYLMKHLSQIDKKTLPSAVQTLYDELYAELDSFTAIYKSETMNFDLSTVIAPEAYIKLGDDAARNDWHEGYNERSPFFDLGAEFAWSDYVYGNFSFPLKLRLEDAIFNEEFSQNVYIKRAEPFQRITPFDAGISIGNSFINFFVGRGQLNMGQGYTGNLFVADNFQFQDFGKLSIYDDFFSYDFTYTHFNQESPRGTDGVNSILKSPMMTFNPPHQSRVTHSYTFDFADKVTVSIKEGAILQTNTAFDIRMLNPFSIIHNWQGFEKESGYWANNFMGVDFGFALGGGFRLSAQIVIDQLQTGAEISQNANMYPNAFGALLNISNVSVVNKGFLESWVEAVYTSPYLYLNDIKTDPSSEDPNKVINENMDLILGYYLAYGSDISYSGYKYGPDSIVLSIGGSYVPFSQKCSISYMLMYRAHGERGIKYYEGQNQTPTSIAGKDHLFDFALTGVIEHTFLASLSLDYNLVDSLSISTGFTFQHKINYNNQASNSWNNMQIRVGFSFDPMDFLR